MLIPDQDSQRLLRLICVKLPLCLTVFLITLFPFVASSQSRFDSLTTDNGLHHNSVLSILQSRDGYLWITTSDGLVRFDGLKCTVFNAGNTEGIESNRFNFLYEDGQGALWIGTEDGGVIQYHKGRFRTVVTADQMPDKLVRGIYKSNDGGVLIFTGASLICMPEGGSDDSVPKVISNTSIGYHGEKEILWYLDQARLHLLIDGVWKSHHIPEAVPLAEIIAVHEDREGNLWVATKGLKLFRVRDGYINSHNIKDSLPQDVADAKGEIYSFYEDRQGNLWLATGGQGAISFSQGRFTVYTKAQGLTSNVIRQVYGDREGIIWIGTWSNGLNKFRKQTITVYSDQDGSTTSNVYPIFEDRAGNVWAGVWGTGLKKFREGLLTPQTESHYLPNHLVTALAEDRDGRLWIGTYGQVYSLKNEQITDHSIELGLLNREVRAIYQDSEGNLWFGTTTGLTRYKDGKITLYTSKDGLAGDEIKVILEDREGTLWIGTYGGLSSFKNGAITSYRKEDGLASNRIRALYQDRDGALWIGTYDGGLSRLKDGRITSCTTVHGLFNNGVFQILEDSRGNFWMSCNVGIYQVSRQQLNDFADGKIPSVISVAYGKSDGLINTECNGGSLPAGVRTRDGRLLFPTQAGVAVINPESIPINSEMPPVSIESCLLDRKAVDFQDEVQIAPGINSIEINYTALSFIKSDHIRFKYRLEGLDSEWADIGTRRAAYYSYLPPGSYTFRVIAANTDGVWNTTGASLRIRVIPPFYRTWWFITLAILTFLATGAGVYRWRIMRLKRANAAQEEFSRRLIDLQESERKRIAAELHDSVSQSLVIIKNRAVLSLSAPDDSARALEQLEEIDEAADQAIEELKEIAYNLRPFQLDRLGLTKAIESMITKVAASHDLRIISKLDNTDGILSAESEINLYRIVQESINNIVRHAQATDASLVIRRNPRVIEVTIKDNGRGFNPDSNPVPESGISGFGLTSIVERARIIGAKAHIESAPGQGTTISISIPQSR